MFLHMHKTPFFDPQHPQNWHFLTFLLFYELFSTDAKYNVQRVRIFVCFAHENYSQKQATLAILKIHVGYWAEELSVISTLCFGYFDAPHYVSIHVYIHLICV